METSVAPRGARASVDSLLKTIRVLIAVGKVGKGNEDVQQDHNAATGDVIAEVEY